MKMIDVKGEIVDDQTAVVYDWLGMPAVSPQGIANTLNEADGEPVQVNIASGGGDVFAASEIYTKLKQYAGDVNVQIEGLAASAASVIAMAGTKVSMAPTAQLMIHKAWTGSQGNADDMQHESDVLSSIDESIAAAYETRTGMDQGKILQMMEQETWMTAKDAVDKGFVDEILFVDEKELAPVNAVTTPLPKSTINKVLNVLMKQQAPEIHKEQKENNSTQSPSEPSLRERKVAILLGK